MCLSETSELTGSVLCALVPTAASSRGPSSVLRTGRRTLTFAFSLCLTQDAFVFPKVLQGSLYLLIDP